MVTALGYCKINLYLQVVGHLPGGYHALESVMHSLQLHDQVQVKEAREISLTYSWVNPMLQGAVFASPSGADIPREPIPCDASNLAWKAAELLRTYCEVDKGAAIHLKKAVPAAAGLGGGSADAAAALVALNQLWDLGLHPRELQQLGAKLGADVPFCITGGCRLCRGMGEEMSDAPVGPGWYVMLVKPAFSLSTKLVYETLDVILPESEKIQSAGSDEYRQVAAASALDSVLSGLATQDMYKVGRSLYNTLETASFHLEPQLREWKELVQQTDACGVLMSGSGPTIFALFQDKERAVGSALFVEEKGRDIGPAQVIVTQLGWEGVRVI